MVTMYLEADTFKTQTETLIIIKVYTDTINTMCQNKHNFIK